MIRVEIDPRQFTQWLTKQAQQQVPFAAARALTNLAKAGQNDLRQGIQRNMTVRRPRVLQGIQVRAAQKKDGLTNMQAEVGSRDWYMADQLADQASDRKSAGRKQYIPMNGVRPSRSQNVPARLRPKPVYLASQKPKSPIFFRRSDRNVGLVLQQTRQGGLRLLYVTLNQQRVNPKLRLSETVGASVQRNFDREFIKQMGAAIKSARG
jgi:hypothetical protein